MRHGRFRFVLALLVLFGAPVGRAAAQEDIAETSRAAMRGPRFLSGVGEGALPIDPAGVAALRRRVTLPQGETTINAILQHVATESGVQLRYSRDVVPVNTRIQLEASRLTLAAALTEILLDAGVDIAVARDGQLVLVRRRGPANGRLATGTIVGRVTDAKTGEPVVAADVWLEGTKSRGTTGEKGFYRLADVEVGNYTLVVRRLGYAKQNQKVTVAADREVTADVGLQPVATQLNEIVTTVTGEQRKLELGHVVGSINADSVVKAAPISTLSDLLNARVPGLQVFQTQGTVGGEVRLQVRGFNSMMLNSEPIVIVDGVRYSSRATARPTATYNGAGNVELTSPLNDINPNDVENVEVVKGPSAATLYGTDAANGVIVITTKRGKAGPARWNVYGRAIRDGVPEQHYPDLYWGWSQQMPTTSCSLAYVGRGYCTQDSVTVVPNPLNNSDLTIFGAKPTYETGLNVSGGREDLRYYLSGDYQNAQGPIQMPKLILDRLMQQRGGDVPDEWRTPNAQNTANVRANGTADLGSKLSVTVNTGYSRNSTRSLIIDNAPYLSGQTSTVPNAPYGGSSGGRTPDQAFAQTSTESVDRFIAGFNFDARPISWLLLRGNAGLDYGGRNRFSLVRPGDIPSTLPDGYVSDERTRQTATTANLNATVTAQKDRFSFRTSVGGQYNRTLANTLAASGIGLPPGGNSVGNAMNVRDDHDYSETVTLGTYLEEQVGFNNRLFVTGSVRADGASTFGRDYDVSTYYKFGASWLASDETFFPRIPTLSQFRLRYSYGSSGRQPNAEWALPEYYTGNSALIGGQQRFVAELNGLGNPNLRPTRVGEHEFGFDLGAFDNRLRMESTWFTRRVTDDVVSHALAPGMGYAYTNIGLSTQHGFELQVIANVLETRPVSLDLTFTHSLQRTKLVKLGDGSPAMYAEGGWVEGYPLGARFQRAPIGYNDANGDGIIDFREVQYTSEPVYLGESQPPFTRALTAALGFFNRQIRVTGLFDRRYGFTQIDALTGFRCGAGACYELVDPRATLAQQAYGLSVYPYGAVQKGDFTRFRELSVAVDFPQALNRALRVRSATLSLQVRNLALWTDFSGPDPESAMSGTITQVSGGVAAGTPQARGWTVRMDLGL